MNDKISTPVLEFYSFVHNFVAGELFKVNNALAVAVCITDKDLMWELVSLEKIYKTEPYKKFLEARKEHFQNIINIVEEKGYDGIDFWRSSWDK